MSEHNVRQPLAGAVLLNPHDTVATALEELVVGQEVPVRDDSGVETLTVRTSGPVPVFHKIAVREHAAGEEVIKYGEPIGIATRPILLGEHVHTQNLRSVRGETDGHRGF